MRKPKPPEGRRPPAALAALLFVALAACALSPAAAGQSGRRKPGSPPPPTTGAGTSVESKPEAKKAAPLLSLVVMSDFTASYDIDTYTRRLVEDGFANRLGGVNGLSLTRAGRGSRKDARDRAKNETAAYVVFLQVELDRMPPSTTRQQGTRPLVLHTYIYAPKTGDLKYTDATYQRSSRPSVGVGGVRLPVPTSGRGYPSEYDLRQLAHDAADRVLSRLQITPPPDNR